MKAFTADGWKALHSWPSSLSPGNGGLSPGGAVRNSSSSSMGQFLITARTEEGTKSEKLAWSGFSQVASSLTSTEALSLRSRARSVSGPSAPADWSRPHCPGHPPSTANACPPSPGGRVGRRVNGLRLLAAPHALRGALLHPGHGAAGADPGCGLLAQGAVLQAPVPQASALANLLSRGAEPGLMLILHLGDVEGLHNALQAPLLELGASKPRRSRWTCLVCRSHRSKGSRPPSGHR